jgi:predicted trehalose synthase
MEEEYRMQKAKEEERKTSFSYAAPKTSTTEHADNEDGDHEPTESSDQPKEQTGGDDDDGKDALAEKLDEVNLDEDNQPLQTDDAESTTTTLADLPKMENTSLERPRQAAEDPKVRRDGGL